MSSEAESTSPAAHPASSDAELSVSDLAVRKRRNQRIGLTAAVLASVAAVGSAGALLAGGWQGSHAIALATDTAQLTATSTPTALAPLTPTPTTVPSTTVSPSTNTPSPTAPDTNPAIAGLELNLTDPNSITVLVNKQTPLGKDFVPNDLVKLASVGVTSANDHSMRREAANAARELSDAAGKAGFNLDFASGYRSYSLQDELYSGYVDQLGQVAADATSARPGFSEHQTGLAVDIYETSTDCILEGCFGDTEPGKWLAENSWRYGFILRYENGTQSIVGYEYEPWHFRYVGKDVAAAYHEAGAHTYEEFIGAPAAPDYG